MVKFKTNKDGITKIVTKAINASMPVGMSMLQYIARDYNEQEVIERGVINGNDCYVDYFDGRMVKLYIDKVKGEEDTYITRNELDIEYQSFKIQFNTMTDLLKSVDGVVIIED